MPGSQIVYAHSFESSSSMILQIGCCNNRQDYLTGNAQPYFSQGLLAFFFEIAAVDSSIFYNDAGQACWTEKRKKPDPTLNKERCQTLSLTTIWK
jgi:hypothetical protein